MKKIISLVLVAMLLLSVMPFAVNAAEKATLTIVADRTTVCPGQEVTLTVMISNNPGYLGYSIDLDAELKGFEVVDYSPESVSFNPANATYNNATTAPVVTEGELFTLTLKAVTAIATDLTFDFEKAEMFDANVNEVDLTLVGATISVGHSFTAYVSDGEGFKTAACDYGCGATDTLEDDAPVHTHEYTGKKVLTAEPPSCTEIGRVYTQVYCVGCGLVKETAVKVIPATGHFDYDKNELCDDCGISLAPVHVHELVKVDAKAATCTENGNIDYWYCSACDWVEVEGGLASNLKAVQTPAAHTLEYVAAVAPTATENGNIEYWYCTACDWMETTGGVATNRLSVILPATGEVINPPTGDNAIFYVVALAVIATLGVAVVSFKKREEN